MSLYTVYSTFLLRVQDYSNMVIEKIKLGNVADLSIQIRFIVVILIKKIYTTS